MRTSANAANATLLDAPITRIEALLDDPGAAQVAASHEPIVAIFNAAALSLGVRQVKTPPVPPDQPVGETLMELGRGCGILVREVSALDGFEPATAGVIVAIRAEDGAPLLVRPGHRRSHFIDADGTRTIARNTAGPKLQRRAYVLSPALPATQLGPISLLRFGIGRVKGDLAAFLLLSLLAGVLASMTPMAGQEITESVIPGRELPFLVLIIGLMVALFAVNLAVRLAAEIALVRIDGRIGSMLRFAAADRAVHQGTENMPPPIAALAARALPTFHRSVWRMLLQLAAGLLIALPSLAVMTSAAPWAAALVFGTIAGAVAITVLIARRQVARMLDMPVSPMSWMASAYEALSQLETVRAQAAEARLFGRWTDAFLNQTAAQLGSERIGASARALTAGLEAVVIAAGAFAIAQAHATIETGHAIAFALAMATVAGAGLSLVGAASQWGSLGLMRKLIAPLLVAPPATAAKGRRLQQIEGALRLDHVSVQRGPHEPALLDRVDLAVRPGEHIGIAGPSGAGKSTLFKLLLGLIEPTAGQVMFEGIDLKQIDLVHLRRQIGVVGQNAKLFPGSLLDNIAAGADLSVEEAWEALRLAAIADEVRALPLGLSTPVGDSDPMLSGGQVQRIALARALARKPRILILDEATSALDASVEAQVAANLATLDCSIVAIAHRLDTLSRCDRIYVLDQGRVAECGSYAELAAADGLFAGLIAAEARAMPAPRNVPLEERALLQRAFG